MSRSNRRLAVLAAILLIGALVAVLWTRRGGDSGAKNPEAAQGSKTKAPPAPIRIGGGPAAPANRARSSQAPVRLSAATIQQDAKATNGHFSGRVVNWGSGKGVAGAEIVFASDDGAVTIRSEPDGTFGFAPPRLGRYRLAVASADGFLPYAPRWGRSPIELVARAERRVSGLIIYMTPAIRYRGTVVSDDDQPVAGATIRLLGADRGERTLVSIKDTFKSDAKGRFEFSAPDWAVLEAKHDDHEPGRGRVDRTVQITHKLTIKMGGNAGALPPGAHGGGERADGKASVRGKVVSESGAPVAAFTVAVLIKRGLAERTVAYTSVFDSEGRFEVGGIAPGDYVVRAAGYGYSPSAPVSASAAEGGGSPVTVTLPRGGVLFGKVVSAESKEPLASARISVEGSMGTGTSALPMVSSAVSDEQGEFELAGLPPGRASVVAAAFNHNSRIVSKIAVTSGARIGPITIALTAVKEGETPKLELAGIGAALRINGDGLEIQRIFPGSGAGAAGLVVGDVIMRVNDRAITELGFQGAIQEIRGPIGTTVKLTVRRANGETGDVVATRMKIRA